MIKQIGDSPEWSEKNCMCASMVSRSMLCTKNTHGLVHLSGGILVTESQDVLQSIEIKQRVHINTGYISP